MRRVLSFTRDLLASDLLFSRDTRRSITSQEFKR